MTEKCEACGKGITGIVSNFMDHAGKVGFYVSPDYGSNMRGMGGKCGSCGKMCCSDCYKNGACPSCRERLSKSGSLLGI